MSHRHENGNPLSSVSTNALHVIYSRPLFALLAAARSTACGREERELRPQFDDLSRSSKKNAKYTAVSTSANATLYTKAIES